MVNWYSDAVQWGVISALSYMWDLYMEWSLLTYGLRIFSKKIHHNGALLIFVFVFYLSIFNLTKELV